MLTTLITYEEAKAQVGTLHSCHPRPDSTNIDKLVNIMSERVAGLPSIHSQDHGYYGTAVTPEEYALVHNIQCQEFPDPGPIRGALGGTATSTK